MFDYDILVADSTSSITCEDNECISSSQNCENCVIDLSDNSIPRDTLPSPVRKSSRSSRPPVWHKDYVIKVGSKKCNYSFASALNYSGSTYQSFVSKFSVETGPSNYLEAEQDPRWVDAMNNEIKVLEDNKTWELVTLPKSKMFIGCKWVYKIKYNADRSVERFKARLVAKGYNQKKGFDYQETFSPMVKMATVRSVVSIVAANHWTLHQMNVYNDFLRGDLYEEV